MYMHSMFRQYRQQYARLAPGYFWPTTNLSILKKIGNFCLDKSITTTITKFALNFFHNGKMEKNQKCWNIDAILQSEQVRKAIS